MIVVETKETQLNETSSLILFLLTNRTDRTSMTDDTTYSTHVLYQTIIALITGSKSISVRGTRANFVNRLKSPKFEDRNDAPEAELMERT